MSGPSEAHDSPLWITEFASHDSPHGQRVKGTWAELRVALSTPLEGRTVKGELPGFSLAVFKGDYRSRSNVELAFALGFDVDGGVSLEQAVAHWGGRTALFFTTFSHTSELHRFRVIVRPSRPMTAAEYESCHEFERRRAEAAGIRLAGADEAKDASRFWYAAARPPNGLYEVRETTGTPLDVDAVVAAIPPRATDAYAYESELLDHQASKSTSNPEGLQELAVLCAGLRALDVGGRHAGLYQVACRVGELIARGEIFQDDVPAVSARDAERQLLLAVEHANWGDHANDPATIQDGLARGYSEHAPVVRLAQLPQTDLGNAIRFVALFGDRVRYCAPKKMWLGWTGKRWKWDEKGAVVELAKLTVRHIRTESKVFPATSDAREALRKHAKDSESVGKIAALLSLARSDAAVAVLPADLDRDLLAFNCDNGTLDLKTGALRPHDPSDLITMISPVSYRSDVAPGIWAKTVAKITGTDRDLARYLQKLAGYCLTGHMRVKEFWFAYGDPDGLKSTFIDALAAMMGDYAEAVDAHTWLRRKFTPENRGDVVSLRGKRMVYTVEFPRVAVFDEMLMKKWTGGDVIRGADKYEKHITFRPTGKVLLAGNDAPIVDDADEGMWSRCRRLPFTNALLPHEIDKGMREKLRDPAVGGVEVLHWAVEGLRGYLSEGLEPPASVAVSTRDYRREMDQVGRFLHEFCELTPEARTRMSELRDAFDDWRRDNGDKFAPSAKNFNAKLRKAGLQIGKSGQRYWQGVRLLSSEEREDTASQPEHVRRAESLIDTLKRHTTPMKTEEAPRQNPTVQRIRRGTD